jgi:hypothetical protein
MSLIEFSHPSRRADRGRRGRARRTPAPARAISLAVFAPITPSNVRHRPLLAWVLLFGLSVKTPRQSLREVIQGSGEAPGRCAAAFSAWSCGNLGLRPLVRPSCGFGPRRSDAHRDRSRPRTASDVIRPKESKGKLGCGGALEDHRLNSATDV